MRRKKSDYLNGAFFFNEANGCLAFRSSLMGEKTHVSNGKLVEAVIWRFFGNNHVMDMALTHACGGYFYKAGLFSELIPYLPLIRQ